MDIRKVLHESANYFIEDVEKKVPDVVGEVPYSELLEDIENEAFGASSEAAVEFHTKMQKALDDAKPFVSIGVFIPGNRNGHPDTWEPDDSDEITEDGDIVTGEITIVGAPEGFDVAEYKNIFVQTFVKDASDLLSDYRKNTTVDCDVTITSPTTVLVEASKLLTTTADEYYADDGPDDDYDDYDDRWLP